MRHRAMWRFIVVMSFSFPLCVPAQGADCADTPYNCAVFYVQQGNPRAAIQSLTVQLQHAPNDLKALNLLGIALTESGQTQEADRRFQEALEFNPRFYPARKNLAINEFDEHRYREAEVHLTRVLQEVPNDPITHVYLGEISFERKDCATALRHYNQAYSRLAEKGLWVLHDAQCELEQQNAARATAVLHLIAEKDAADRFQGGLLLGRAGAYADAAEFFGSARKGYSDPYAAGYNQLLMLTRGARYPQAIQLFDQLVSEGYGKAELYNLVSEDYVKSGHLKQAYDALRTATRLEPEAEDNYVDLAMLCLQYENYDLGLEILGVGLHYAPNSYRLHVQRGVTLVMTGHMEDAEKEFLTASALAPEKPLPYVALSEVWMQSGQTQKAVELLRSKRNLPGTDFIVPYIFALSLIRSGAGAGTPQGEDAMQALERSIRLKPDFARSHAELGELLLKAGDADRGIAQLEIATKLDPNDAGPLYQLGMAYRRKGETTKAKAFLARVAQIHSPEHEPDMKQELKRLVRLDTAPSETQAKP